MGSQEVIPRTALRRTNESKQLETTLNTQAAIQASRLLTSGLFFGLVGRVHRSSGGLGNMVHVEHDLKTQGDDGSFFLEPI